MHGRAALLATSAVLVRGACSVNHLHVEMIATLLHPGDLSLGDWARLLGMFVAFIVLPIVIIGFIVFKVVSRHSGGGDPGSLPVL